MNTNVISLVWRGSGSGGGSNCNLDREQGRWGDGGLRRNTSRLVVGVVEKNCQKHRRPQSGSFVREVKW